MWILLFTYLQFFSVKGHGHYLRYMEGMFRANGGCGYVKKPDILLNEVYNPRVLTRPTQKTTLQVKGMWIHI